MELDESIENLKPKLKEIKNLRNLNNKDLKFKSWYVSTINLLKNLPSSYSKEVNSFKKLTFTDTKYHRGKKLFSPLNDNKYNQDLTNAEEILKKIIQTKKNKNKLTKEISP